MALVDQIDFGAGFVPSGVRYANTSGTVLTSAVDADTGEKIPDDYTLTLSSVSGGTGTVTVTSSSPNNPYNGRVKTGRSLNGSTVYKDVIPGVSLVFHASGANGSTADVHVGAYQGAVDSIGDSAGVPSSGIRHKVVNIGSGLITNAKVKLLTQVVAVKKIGSAISKVFDFAPGATEKVAGGGSEQVMPYVLSISAVAGSGGSKTCDIAMDGVVFAALYLRDLVANTVVSGTGVKAIDNNPYQVLLGPLAGLIFYIDAACANSDTCNVMIFAARYAQIAGDISGAEGPYGVTDVTLTESGQPSGNITASGVAYYWSRVVVPADSNNESNPHPANVCLFGDDAGSAGW